MMKKDRYIYLFIVVISFMIYGNTISHDYVLDDKMVISENDNVQRGFAAIPSLFTHTTDFGYVDNKEGTAYRPLTQMSYAIEIGVFGLNPSVNHFFNVLYYTILCFLLYFLLSQYIFHHKHKLLSFMITTLFLIHPIHTEVVSNIKSRDEIFSMLFFVVSIVLLFKYNRTGKIFILVISALMYLSSLFSKENAIVFIVLIPLFLYFFQHYRLKEILVVLIPYLIVLIIFLFARSLVIEERGTEITYVNNAILMYEGFFERYAMVFYILLLYLKLLIFPYPLIWDYSYGHFYLDNMVIALAVVSVIIHLALFIFAIWNFKKKNIYSFLILLYLVSLSVVSNVFIFIGSTMSERFLFFPSLAFCILIVYLAGNLFNLNFGSAKPKFRPSAIAVLLILFVGLSVYSYSESCQWKNDRSLILSDYNKTRSFRARMAYIESLYKQAKEMRDNRKVMDRARSEMSRVLRDFPEEAEAWYMNGLISSAYGDKKNAIESYKKVLKRKEKHLAALNNLGTVYHNEGDYDSALKYYNAVLDIDSSYYMVYGNIGMIYHFLNQYDKAKEYYSIHLEYEPSNTQIRKNLNLVMKELNK